MGCNFIRADPIYLQMFVSISIMISVDDLFAIISLVHIRYRRKTGPRNHNSLVSDCYPIGQLRKEIIDTFEKNVLVNPQKQTPEEKSCRWFVEKINKWLQNN